MEGVDVAVVEGGDVDPWVRSRALCSRHTPPPQAAAAGRCAAPWQETIRTGPLKPVVEEKECPGEKKKRRRRNLKPHLEEAIGTIQIQKSVMGMLHIVCGAGLIFPFTLPICAAGVITSALHPKTVVGAAQTPGSWNSLPWRRAGPIVACASDPALDAAAARVVKAAGAFGDDSAAFATKWTQKILAGETPLEMGLLEECLVDEGQDKCMELEEAIKEMQRMMGNKWSGMNS